MGKLEPSAAAAGTNNEPVTCPWCGSEDTEQLAMYSSILMTDQHHCRSCLNFFERVLKR